MDNILTMIGVLGGTLIVSMVLLYFSLKLARLPGSRYTGLRRLLGECEV
jgi:hypothetical protein